MNTETIAWYAASRPASRLAPLILGVFLFTLGARVATAVERPLAVSPGSPAGTRVEARCPTFSWGSVEGASGYELVVFRIGADGSEAGQVMRESFSGSVSSWTPPLDRCLERAVRYAWSVRAVEAVGASQWSAPSLFEVAAPPSYDDFESALAVVRDYLAASEAASAPGQEAEASDDPRSGHSDRVAKKAPGSTSTERVGGGSSVFSVDGLVEATAFSGDGSALTSLVPENLSAGTAAIDVSGTAANVTGIVALGNGGTGATDAAGARASLGVAAAVHPHTEADIVDLSHTVDTNAAILCGAGEYLDGEGECRDIVAPITSAIFGSDTVTHYTADDWVLESTSVSNITLRSTTGAPFLNYAITYPTNCSGSGSGGSADVAQAFRFSTLAGQTLVGTFCTEGSTIYAQVSDGLVRTAFRCWQRTGNQNKCQRLTP